MCVGGDWCVVVPSSSSFRVFVCVFVCVSWNGKEEKGALMLYMWRAPHIVDNANDLAHPLMTRAPGTRNVAQ